MTAPARRKAREVLIHTKRPDGVALKKADWWMHRDCTDESLATLFREVLPRPRRRKAK